MDRGPRLARVRLTVWTYAAGSCSSWLTLNWPQEGSYVAPVHDRRSFVGDRDRLGEEEHLLNEAFLAHFRS